MDVKKVSNIYNYHEDILVLVNYDNEIPSKYKTKLIDYKGHLLSEVLLNSLIEMELQASLDGIELVINNAYRSKNSQKKIFNDTVKKYQKEGYNYNKSKILTSQIVSYPGYSEHETGLAIDFSESGNNKKNELMWNWLNDNAYKYGFILRYPSDKTNITKINFEPWHYRYVGKSAAKIIKEEDLSLEEYILRGYRT